MNHPFWVACDALLLVCMHACKLGAATVRRVCNVSLYQTHAYTQLFALLEVFPSAVTACMLFKCLTHNTVVFCVHAGKGYI